MSTSMPMTDAQLLDAFVTSGSQEAFGELVARHFHWIETVARRRLRDPGLADDATQAVFILLAQKAPSLRRETVLSVWLFSALRYSCMAIARSERRRKRREEQAAAMRAAEATTDAVENELSDKLDELVARLSKPHRQVVLLRFYENKSNEEVAATLGVSEDAARKRVERAVETLSAMFRRRGMNCDAGVVGAAMMMHVMPQGASVGVGFVTKATAVAGTALSASSSAGATVAKTVGGMMAAAHAKAAAIAAAVMLAAVLGAGVVIAKAREALATAAKAQATTSAAPATAPVQEAAINRPTFAAGQIFAPDGSVFPGARVEIYAYDWFLDGVVSVARGSSDANGRFRLKIPDKAESPGILIDAPPYAFAGAHISADADRPILLKRAHTAEVALRMPDGSPAAGVLVAPAQSVGTSLTSDDTADVQIPESIQKIIAQRTDAQGKCTLSRLPGTQYMTIDVLDPRFAKTRYTFMLEVGPRKVNEPVQLALSSSISGRVMDLDGKPAAGVVVGADPAMGANAVARTDAAGNYRIDRLPANTYRVMVGASADVDWTRPAPWTAEPRDNVVVSSGAAVSGIDFQEIRGTLIRGKVSLQDSGVGVAGMSVSIYSPGRVANAYGQSTTTGADGTYTLRTPAGKQSVQMAGFVPDGYALPKNREQDAKSVTTTDSTVATVNFTIAPAAGLAVSGVVRRDDGWPAAWAQVEADMTEGGEFYSRHTQADENGRFHFRALPAKTWLHATCGSLIEREPVKVLVGNAKDAEIVVEKFAPVTITGLVTDTAGHGIAGAEVAVSQALGNRSATVNDVLTDDQGRYTIRYLRFGYQYSLHVQAKRFGQASVNVTMKHGASVITQATAVLPTADSFVSGTVVNEAGQPVADVMVAINGNATAYERTKTDNNGAFEFVDVVEGERLAVSLTHDNESFDGGSIEAGTVGAQIVMKKTGK